MNGRETRAERLKLARSIAGFNNRRDFCSQFDFPYDTLEAWERGKNPLTLKGATRIVGILKSVGVYCSPEWLMKGEGLSPCLLKEVLPNIDLSGSLDLFEKNIALSSEISTFTTLHRDSIITIIKDESMLPFYEKGDYVGGIRLRGDDIINALNKKCIIEFGDESVTVGQLQKANKPPFYKVHYLNESPIKTPKDERSSLDIISAAPILWHRTFFNMTKELKK